MKYENPPPLLLPQANPQKGGKCIPQLLQDSSRNAAI